MLPFPSSLASVLMLLSDARIALACLDLTSLGDDDTPALVAALARRAHTPYGAPVALCVHPELIFAARLSLMREGIAQVRVATAISCDGDQAHTLAQTRRVIAVGADEIELVFPTRPFLAGDKRAAQSLIERVKALCSKLELKVSLPQAALANGEDLQEAATLAIAAGADFLQISLTREDQVANLAAPTIAAIRAAARPIGLKINANTEDLAQLNACIALASELYDRERVVPARFRIASNALLDRLLPVLAAEPVDED